MKQILFFFVLSTVLFFACSKENQTNRKIDGEWKPVTFSLFDYNGMKQNIDCTGKVLFSKDGKGSKTGKYVFQLYFDFNGSPINLIEEGTYTVENKFNIQLVSNTGEKTYSNIVYMSKGDMIYEIPNKAYLGYYFVLKK